MNVIRRALIAYGHIKHHVPTPVRSIFNMAWSLVGYLGILGAALPFNLRFRLIRDFLRVDMNIKRGHQPSEISQIVKLLARYRPSGELFIEAGCLKGSSSCKFSLLAKIFDYQLWIYDSFAGVEVTLEDPDRNFSGMYKSTRDEVQENITKFGAKERCKIIPGWFSDTISKGAAGSVSVVYIDCDLAKGTKEVLKGVVQKLSPNGMIFTQDYHIPVVKELLHDNQTWNELMVEPPLIRHLTHNLAVLTWN